MADNSTTRSSGIGMSQEHPKQRRLPVTVDDCTIKRMITNDMVLHDGGSGSRSFKKNRAQALLVIAKYASSHVAFRRATLAVDALASRDHRGHLDGWHSSTRAIMVTTPLLPFTIVWVNPAFEQVFGYSLEEARGRTPRMLQGPDTNHSVARHKQIEVIHMVSFHREDVVLRQFVNVRRNGTPILVDMAIHYTELELGQAGGATIPLVVTSMKPTPVF